MKKYLKWLPLIGFFFIENDKKEMSWSQESLFFIKQLVNPYCWYQSICGTLLLIMIIG